MYLSKLTLHTGKLLPSQLLHLVERGEYVMHQWLWDLFPGVSERQFLYRREELQGAFRFYVLSVAPPANSDVFDIESRLFAPSLSEGAQLCFSMRANPTVCKAGKRHDLLMDAKQQARKLAVGGDIWSLQQKAAQDWLAHQGELNGFSLRQVNVNAYRQQQIFRAKSHQTIHFSSVDYSGELVVNDPQRFLQRLAQGYGNSRAFGCGLMLIKYGNSA